MRDSDDITRTVREHANTVARVCSLYFGSRPERDDAFQETFLKYAQEGRAFGDDEHRKAWLIRVTINRCRSLQRQWLRRRHMPITAEPAVAFESPEESAVDEAMARLPQKYRSVIHLHYYEGYTTDEIARITQQRPSAVRTQLTRARRMLGGLLKGDETNV